MLRLVGACSALLCTVRSGNSFLVTAAKPAFSSTCNAMSSSADGSTSSTDLNVLGQPLKVCSTSPMTGFHRDGFCHCGGADRGVHSVCAVLTDDFLQYTKVRRTAAAAARNPVAQMHKAL